MDGIEFKIIEDLWLKKIWKTGETFNLYIDNPFCVNKCKFCVHFGEKAAIGSEKYNEYYDEQLPQQLLQYERILNSRKIDSLYFGGGTPSLMTASKMKEIFNLIPNIMNIKYKHFEAHPAFLTKEKMDILAEYGFKYISIGIQTLDKEINEYNSRTSINNSKLKEITSYIQNEKKLHVNIDLLAYIYRNNLDNRNPCQIVSNDITYLADEIKPDFITIYSMYQDFNINFYCSNLDVLSGEQINEDLEKIVNLRRTLLKVCRSSNEYRVWGLSENTFLNRDAIKSNLLSDVYLTRLTDKEVNSIRAYNCSSYPYQPQSQNTIGIGGQVRRVYSYMGKSLYYDSVISDGKIQYFIRTNDLGVKL